MHTSSSSMHAFEIYTPTANEVHSGELGRRMRQFNYRVIGEYGQTQPVWISAKDAGGKLVGGLVGDAGPLIVLGVADLIASVAQLYGPLAVPAAVFAECLERPGLPGSMPLPTPPGTC